MFPTISKKQTKNKRAVAVEIKILLLEVLQDMLYDMVMIIK